MNSKLENLRFIVPLMAITGAITMGIHSPNSMGSAAMSVLSTAVGGFYGHEQAKSETVKKPNT